MCAGTATTEDAQKIGDGTIDKELEELASTKERIAAALTAKGITLSENAGLLNYGPAIAAKSCCTAGTYSTSGMNPCENCGIGHYCTGGAQRAACTYGAIACTGTSHTYDAALPSIAQGTVNKVLTKNEVDALIPPTTISQWKRISCCNTQFLGTPSEINTPNYGCAMGTIGPGTYLFVERYPAGGNIDSITGEEGVSSAHIVVFDHSVGYKSMHGYDIFNTFVDTNNATFTSYILGLPQGSWSDNINNANVSNIGSEIENFNLCVYELK
jgi:hypothetical protein